MKILYVSQHFPPETGAAQGRAFDMAKNLMKRDNDVTVLTAFPNYPIGKIYPSYQGKIFMNETVEGIQVKRSFILPDSKAGVIVRLLNYFSFFFSSIIAGMFTKKHEVVLATSPQLFVGLAGYIISRFHGAKFVLEIRDLWVDFAELLGQFRNKRILNLARKLENFLYKKADKIVTVTHGYKEHLVKSGIDANKIEVVTNGIDEDFFKPNSIDISVRKKYNLKDKFVILYAGNLGAAQGLDVIPEAAEKLKDIPEIVFLVVGEGVEKEKLVNEINSRNLDNIILEKGQTKDGILSFYNGADASLICLKKHPLFDITLPSKIFDSLAMAKPILIGVGGEGKDIITAAEAGVPFEPENSTSLVNAIMTLYNKRKDLAQMGAKGRNYALANYTRQELAKKLESVLISSMSKV
jgi:glycosyltransferase involved in cell wall biosynthesis